MSVINYQIFVKLLLNLLNCCLDLILQLLINIYLNNIYDSGLQLPDDSSNCLKQRIITVDNDLGIIQNYSLGKSAKKMEFSEIQNPTHPEEEGDWVSKYSKCLFPGLKQSGSLLSSLIIIIILIIIINTSRYPCPNYCSVLLFLRI